ncbi:hypothetical protein [Ectopseudomonas mendocina]|uniref:hypothetical protein n=1 Tax=Ectopseudomonas mendocina TaxID=300 RepID=UPI000206E410|nr:hypothetical protein [Pseudomonas mendocina]AEB59464.1 hypothetical protein MDS_3433 [Pseudomonas mendocina NK-01]
MANEKPIDESAAKPKKSRTLRIYPAWTFEQSLPLAFAIQEHASGEKVSRLTLFKAIAKSPTSSASQNLITNSAKYGLTKGSHASDYLELTNDGKTITSTEKNSITHLETCFECAIGRTAPFKTLYEVYKGKKLPAHAVFSDTLREAHPDIGETQECIDIFIVNCRYIGLLQEIAGTETLIPIETLIEEIQRSNSKQSIEKRPVKTTRPALNPVKGKNNEDWENICFYVTPIGEQGSIERKHSDLFLSYIVEPAISSLGLTVVRADQIEKAGMITSQIIEHLIKAKLCVVDLSFHNPNVFYEMALRHSTNLPVVQICRQSDRIPFDVNQVRTIMIDDSDIYSLIPKLETYRSEIATQATGALEGDTSNPISVFFPDFGKK